MNPLQAALRDLSSDLRDLRVPFALIGGLAVGVRTEPRFTRDADLAVAVAEDRAAERLVRDLTLRGYRPVTALEQQARDRLSTVRLSSRTQGSEGLMLDLLFASSGIEAETVAGAEVLEVMPGLKLPVASAGHLIALKILARDDDQRPQDLIDLRGLVRNATQADVALAREALTLITRRGFNRGRDLTLAARDVLPP